MPDTSPTDVSTPSSPAEAPKRRRLLRFVLLVVIPVVALAGGGYFYVSSQRYVGTDNAYVKTDMVAVSARVAAPIVSVEVSENQHVDKGDVLFRLSPDDFDNALERAEAELGRVRDEIVAMKATYRQKEQELNLAEDDAAYAKTVFDRQAKLSKKGISSQANFDAAEHDLATARKSVAALRFEVEQSLADLGGTPDIPVEEHPLYRQAKASRDRAWLDTQYAVVTAPFAGVASKTPEVGQYVNAGESVMSVVADRDAWIEANFKETDLAHIRENQAVEVTVDAYPDHVWRGEVQSFSQATGSEFSVLPAQNASGNWVKVVQRIPVRIALGDEDLAPVLRSGMSAVVEIDTGHTPELPEVVLSAVTWIDNLLKVPSAHAEDRP